MNRPADKPAPLTGHVCGWARNERGEWVCAQDYRAEGFQPRTSCGARWSPEKGLVTR